MSKSDIQKQITALKKEMRRLDIRHISHLNAGLTPDEQSYNAELFRLSNELQRPARQKECPACKGKLVQKHPTELDSFIWCQTCQGKGTVDYTETHA